MTRLDIKLPGSAYPILIGPGALENYGDSLVDVLGEKAAIVSDETVWGLHGNRITGVLNRLNVPFFPVVVPPGEKSKSMDMLKRLYGKFFGSGLRRGDTVLAFGGGVIGDLAGFAASTYMRGTGFVQIPTTLLAQVDSSVGGKVAVNLEEGKNLAGSFYQPELVIADTALLDTLPERELASGMAEVVKYAFIDDAGLLDILESAPHETPDMETVICRSCASKARFVEADERDSGVRQFLNFGHTFGHALEKYHRFEKYNHGEAVAVGMVLAAKTGVALGMTPTSLPSRLESLLNRAGLDCRLKDSLRDIIPLMSGDKKNSGGMITLVLIRETGRPFLYKITPEELTRLDGLED